jgi:hypothetical protein
MNQPLAADTKELKTAAKIPSRDSRFRVIWRFLQREDAPIAIGSG